MTRIAKKYSILQIFSIGLTDAFTLNNNEKLQRKNARQDKKRAEKERKYQDYVAPVKETKNNKKNVVKSSKDFTFLTMALDQVLINARQKEGLTKAVKDLENALNSAGINVSLDVVDNDYSSSVSLERETFISVSGNKYANMQIDGNGLTLNGTYVTNGEALYKALS